MLEPLTEPNPVGRPLVHQGAYGGPTRSIAITLPSMLLEAVDQLASERQTNRSRLISEILTGEIEKVT